MLERRGEPDLNAVWLWFGFQKELIGAARGNFAVSNPPYTRFIGQTRREIEDFFDGQQLSWNC